MKLFFSLLLFFVIGTFAHTRHLNGLNFEGYEPSPGALQLPTSWVYIQIPIDSCEPEKITKIDVDLDKNYMYSTAILAYPSNHPLKALGAYPFNGEKFEDLSNIFPGPEYGFPHFVSFITRYGSDKDYKIPKDSGLPIGNQTNYERLVMEVSLNVTYMNEHGITADDMQSHGVSLKLNNNMEKRYKSQGIFAAGLVPGLPFPFFNISGRVHRASVTNVVLNPSPETITCGFLGIPGIDTWFDIWSPLGLNDKLQFDKVHGSSSLQIEHISAYFEKKSNISSKGSIPVKLPVINGFASEDPINKHISVLDDSRYILEATDGFKVTCDIQTRDIDYSVSSPQGIQNLNRDQSCLFHATLYDTGVDEAIVQILATDPYNTWVLSDYNQFEQTPIPFPPDCGSSRKKRSAFPIYAHSLGC